MGEVTLYHHRPHSSSSNGVAERMNPTLMEAFIDCYEKVIDDLESDSYVTERSLTSFQDTLAFS